MESTLICDVCQKKFSSVSTKNRHMKTMHDKKVEEKKSKHIRCPLCSKEKQEALGNHEILINHLTEVHSVSIKQSDLSFRNIEEFEVWRSKENRQVDYACARKKKASNGDQYVYYNCNRSDSYGFQSNCTKRAMKTGGSIRISGICPSRIFVKVFETGMVNVKFVETHVGHQDELRTKRLTKQGVSNTANMGDQFLEEKTIEANETIDFKRRQEIVLEDIVSYVKNLDEESFDKFVDMFRTFRNNLERERNNEICKKRKIS